MIERLSVNEGYLYRTLWG